MITPDQDDSADDSSTEILSGLEQLAQRLDAEVYPGPTRRLTRPERSRRVAWTFVAEVAAATVIVAVALPFWSPRTRRDTPLANGSDSLVLAPTVAGGQAAGDTALPQIVIVEDLDSYSIIDLSAGEPLVSFARKDSYGSEYAGPVCFAVSP